MHRLRRAVPAIYAQHAARHLRAHGVLAKTVDTVVGAIAPFGGSIPSGAVLDLVIATKNDRELAESLLAGFDSTAPELDAGWEAESDPDLSLLDPAYTAPCQSCRYNLRGLGDAGVCPECAAPFDLFEIIFTVHGPEALATCYPEPVAIDEDEQLIALVAPVCPGCRYDLAGLPPLGVCPECGRGYDKPAMIRAAFDIE